MDKDRLRAATEAIVADRAVLQSTIYYGELVDTLKRMDPETYEWHLMPHYQFFHGLLGDINVRTLETHGFALTALVIEKKTRLPGKNLIEWGRGAHWPRFEQGDEAMIEEQHRLAFEHYRINR